MVICHRELIKEMKSDLEPIKQEDPEIRGCSQHTESNDLVDILTDMDDLSWFEKTGWKCQDLWMVTDAESLWQAIVGEIKTPKGALSDVVGQRNYGSEIWNFIGDTIDSIVISEIEHYFIKKCLEYKEVNNVVSINTFIGEDSGIYITANIDSIYGNFNGDMRISNAQPTVRKWRS